MAVTYYGYKSGAYGASAVSSDPYFSYQTVNHSGTQANQTVVSIDACSISNANTNGSSSSGYRMNIEAQIGGTWYTLGYITVGGQLAAHQTFSNFTQTADAALRSLMGKTPPEALRGKVVEGYFHLNAGSVLQLSASTQMDYTACTEPAALSLSATQSEGNVTLSWSGAQAGANNAITGYEVQYQESSDNSSWDAWKGLTTVATSAGSGTLSVAPSATRGNYRRFQVRTMGAAGGGYYSPWKISSNSVRRYLFSTLSLSAQTVNAGESLTATIGIGQSSFTHKLTFVFGGRSQVQELAAGVSSHTFTVPLEWLSQIPVTTSGTATCTLETRSDSTIIDTRSAAFTIVCPASVVPAIGGMSISPAGGTVPPGWNLYVKGYSSAFIQASGITAGTGASMVDYRITGGDYASSRIPYTSGVAHTTALISRSGNVDFTVTVYDSRGRSAQKTMTVNFADYSPPAIEGIRAYRVNASGIADANGTRIAGDVSYSYNLLSAKNTAVVTLSVGSTVVASNVPLAQGSGTYAFNLPGPYEITKSFVVKAVVKDALTQQAEGSVTVNTSARKLNIGSGQNGGVALGKMSEYAKTLELASDWSLRLGQTDVAAAITASANNLTAHANDTGKHVTSAEKTTWNGKANAADLTSHAGDAVKHITAAERTAWNGKVNQSAVIDLAHGGTGATSAAAARSALQITPANIGAAAASHHQGADTINSGVLAEARLPYIVRRGSVSLTGVSWSSVSFSGFTSTPTIVVSYAQNATTSGIAVLKTQSESTTGFQVCMAGSSGSGTRVVNWIAIGS